MKTFALLIVGILIGATFYPAIGDGLRWTTAQVNALTDRIKASS